jgi:intermediate cleaving peptidase 55
MLSRTSLADAATIFGADATERIASFASVLKSALSKSSYIYIDLPQKDTQSTRQTTTKSLLRYLSGPTRSDIDDTAVNVSGLKRKSLASELAPLRAIKSPAEQNLMREAGSVSGRAHAKVLIQIAVTHGI